MGDRANIVIVDDLDLVDGKTGVFLYGHWAGSEMPSILKAGLARQLRWNDAPYLARILFQQLVGGDNGETGFGISTRLTDNEYPLLVVHVPKGEVIEYPQDDYEAAGWANLGNYPGTKFAEYSGEWEDGR